MKPFAWVYSTDANMSATQNFLANQGNLYRVVDVVIGCVGGCDILKRETRDKTDDARITRLEYPIGPIVHRFKLTYEGVDYYRGRIEHWADLPKRHSLSIAQGDDDS